jgi:hypothetical protein
VRLLSDTTLHNQTADLLEVRIWSARQQTEDAHSILGFERL